ncbi:MAG: hypothetical protein JWL93_501 [Hyphomicrobiales bacterium]|nr:hypothetical protein [Hyphomicrobiales bacterium]
MYLQPVASLDVSQPGPAALKSETRAAEQSTSRLLAIDGLRGLAILMVIGFHVFSRWPDLVPYGEDYRYFPPFRLGHLGVQLFFLISGYVILLTLQRSGSGVSFVQKRWLRLFPAMLLCSAFIFLTALWFPERPAGSPVLKDTISGLLFVSPFWLERIVGGQWGQLEGVFWSLFVEVQFYAVFAVMFFCAGRSAAIGFIILLFGISVAVLHDALPWVATPELKGLIEATGFRHFGWFAAGASYYLYRQEGNVPALYVSLAAAAAACWTMHTWGAAAGSAVLVTLFVAAVSSSRVARLAANPALVFFGFVSYPLYLLHENLMVAMIIQMGTIFPKMPGLLLPVIPLLFVTSLAWLVAAHLEPTARHILRRSAALAR